MSAQTPCPERPRGQTRPHPGGWAHKRQRSYGKNTGARVPDRDCCPQVHSHTQKGRQRLWRKQRPAEIPPLLHPHSAPYAGIVALPPPRPDPCPGSCVSWVGIVCFAVSHCALGCRLCSNQPDRDRRTGQELPGTHTPANASQTPWGAQTVEVREPPRRTERQREPDRGREKLRQSEGRSGTSN